MKRALESLNDLVLGDLGLAELQTERVGLLPRLEAEDEVTRPALALLGTFLTDDSPRLASRGSFLLEPLDERDHFSRVALAYDL